MRWSCLPVVLVLVPRAATCQYSHLFPRVDLPEKGMDEMACGVRTGRMIKQLKR